MRNIVTSVVISVMLATSSASADCGKGKNSGNSPGASNVSVNSASSKSYLDSRLYAGAKFSKKKSKRHQNDFSRCKPKKRAKRAR